MSKLFIKPQYFQMLIDILDNYCPNAQIWAYGSRVGGDAHNGSDLDLVVKDFGDENLDIATLKGMFTDSNIPFFIDISEFDKLPEYFQQEILKNYIIIYPKL
jgi:predicted nucleotidyltransferase